MPQSPRLTDPKDDMDAWYPGWMPKPAAPEVKMPEMKMPEMPEMPEMPFQVPMPEMPKMPEMPEMPQMPFDVPEVPAVPGVSGLGSIPGVSSIPGLGDGGVDLDPFDMVGDDEATEVSQLARVIDLDKLRVAFELSAGPDQRMDREEYNRCERRDGSRSKPRMAASPPMRPPSVSPTTHTPPHTTPAVMKRLKMGPAIADRLWKLLDIDGNGIVDVDEFTTTMSNMTNARAWLRYCPTCDFQNECDFCRSVVDCPNCTRETFCPKHWSEHPGAEEEEEEADGEDQKGEK